MNKNINKIVFFLLLLFLSCNENSFKSSLRIYNMSSSDIKNFYFGLDYFETIKANSLTEYRYYSLNKYRVKGSFLTEISSSLLFSETETTTTTGSTSTSTTVNSTTTTSTTINNTTPVTGNEFDTYITIETAEKYTLTIDKSKIELVKEK